MPNEKLYPISKQFAEHTNLNQHQYQALYTASIQKPDYFWGEQAKKFLTWFSPWQEVMAGEFGKKDLQWFKGGKLNACYNCVDRHLEKNSNKTAIIWEGDDPQKNEKITYQQLHKKVCRFANVLKKLGIKKGDTVCIYLPMIPEIAIAALACARIGAVHSVVFGGFSATSLQTRILDLKCKLVITADEGIRHGKIIPSKHNVDCALENTNSVKNVLVIKYTGNKIAWQSNRDIWYQALAESVNSECPAEELDANDPLFILYTSGSTGKPKGIVHTLGGYLLYVAMSHYYIFDYHENDIYWCTADLGWITGHSYLLYGPLANGATTVMFEGVPHYPSFARYWEIIDKYNVSVFYTSPTALRALRHEGDEWVKKSKRTSLRLLGSVGEPINPDVWEWYYDIVGNNKCPIVNTWWQTETGGILITPLPGATPLKPGSAGWPFFGIVPKIFDDKGLTVDDEEPGKLVITQPWPGLMHSIYRDEKRFDESYFKEFPRNYLTGDDAHCDADGYYWITGRDDDVIKVAGHRLGTEELESALIASGDVSEAAVVAIPDEIKGSAIYAFVQPKSGLQTGEALKKKLIAAMRDNIGPIAILKEVQWVDALPKTRSGKIMRRILRKIANGEFKELGDLSTLTDQSVVEKLIKIRKKTPA